MVGEVGGAGWFLWRSEATTRLRSLKRRALLEGGGRGGDCHIWAIKERLSVNTTDRCARWKNRNPPNFVTSKAFGNVFRKYKTQFVGLYIFKNNHFFFNFHLREAFKSTKNVRDILASWMQTETNTMTFPTLNNFMILPLYLNVVTVSKDFNLSF